MKSYRRNPSKNYKKHRRKKLLEEKATRRFLNGIKIANLITNYHFHMYQIRISNHDAKLKNIEIIKLNAQAIHDMQILLGCSTKKVKTAFNKLNKSLLDLSNTYKRTKLNNGEVTTLVKRK